MADRFDPLLEYMDPEEVQALRTKIAEKYNIDLNNPTPGQAADLDTAIRMRLENERKRFEAAESELRRSPGAQQALAETQLNAPVDMTQEGAAQGATAGLPGAGFFGGFTKTASPLVGGAGGSRSLEGEIQDIQSILPKGTEVRQVEQFSSVGSQAEPFVRLPGSTEFIPWNMPGFSQADVGEFTGGLASAEGIISALFTKFPVGNLLSKAFTTGTGAGIGAAIDTALQEKEPAELGEYMSRVGQAFAWNTAFDLGAGGSVAIANFVSGRGSASSIGDPIQEAGQEAASITKEYGLYPLQIGQDRGFSNRLRNRLSQFSDAFRTKLVTQQLTLGDSFFKGKGAIETFNGLDELEQGLIVAGLDNKSLDELYNAKLQEIEATQRDMIRAVENPASRSAGGRAVQQGLFQISNKDRQSFRLVMNARIGRLEDQMVSLAETGRFEIDLKPLQDWANTQLEQIPVPQVPDGNMKIGDIADSSGNTFDFLNKVNDSALRRTLEIIRDIPEGKLTNDVKIPTWIYAGTDAKTGKPKYRAGPVQEVSGLEVLRMIRGSLSDFYGNELVRGTTQEAIAKQAYQQLGDALKGATGSPAFVGAVRKYNAASSYTYKTLDRLVDMNMASLRDPEKLVDSFVNGNIGYQTWNYMRRALMHTGAQGEKDLKLFKDKVTDYYFQNPDRINGLKDMDPKVLNQMYTPEEQNALKTYKSLVDFEKRDSFVKKAAEYTSTKDRALTLYYKTPDSDFSYLMRVLPEKTKVAMRASVIEEALNNSRRAVAGVEGVPDPKKLADELHRAIVDMGPRAKLLFSEDQLKALMDKKAIANFYGSTSRLEDVGSGIAASETTGQAGGMGAQGVGGIIPGAIKVIYEKRLADLIASGPLGVFFQPKLGKPISDQRLRTVVAATTASVRNTMEAEFPKEGEEELLEKARNLRKKGQKVGRYQPSQAQ